MNIQYLRKQCLARYVRFLMPDVYGLDVFVVHQPSQISSWNRIPRSALGFQVIAEPISVLDTCNFRIIYRRYYNLKIKEEVATLSRGIICKFTCRCLVLISVKKEGASADTSQLQMPLFSIWTSARTMCVAFDSDSSTVRPSMGNCRVGGFSFGVYRKNSLLPRYHFTVYRASPSRLQKHRSTAR